MRYETAILGNPDTCRTEAEISNEKGINVAKVYENSDGWHVEVLSDGFDQSEDAFRGAVQNAKEKLSHYANRRGENVPSYVTSAGALSLWLMTKDDGTAIGIKL